MERSTWKDQRGNINEETDQRGKDPRATEYFFSNIFILLNEFLINYFINLKLCFKNWINVNSLIKTMFFKVIQNALFFNIVNTSE